MKAPTIAELRAKRTELISDLKSIEGKIKDKDHEIRELRKTLDTGRKYERALTAQITKLSKEEL